MGIVSNHIGSILDMGFTLGALQDLLVIILGEARVHLGNNVGILLGWIWDEFEMTLEIIWGTQGIVLDNITLLWEHIQIILGTCWDNVGHTLGIVSNHLGTILG